MKRLAVLLFALAVVGCTEKKTITITDPGPVFTRYYVDFYVYQADGTSQGQPVSDVPVNYRDTLLAKFGQLISGPSGYCPRQEWPSQPGPMNLDAKPSPIKQLKQFHVEGMIVNCQPDSTHPSDGICTYPIGLKVDTGF